MGANSPAAIPSLVRGCLRAYDTSRSCLSSFCKNHSAISTVTRQAVLALAQLSPREASRVCWQLKQDGGVMIDVQLELLVVEDPLAATLLLTKELGVALEGSNKNKEALTDVEEAALSSRTNLVGEPDPVVKMRSLVSHLSERANLLITVLDLFANECHRFVEDLSLTPRLSFTLTALCWTLLRIPMDRSVWQNERVHEVFAALMKALARVANRFSEMCVVQDKVDAPTESRFDRPISLLLCSLVSVLMSISADSNETYVKDRTACAATLQKVLCERCFSRTTNGLKSTFACALMSRDCTILCSIMESILIVGHGRMTESAFSSNSSIRLMASKLCHFALEEALCSGQSPIATDERVFILSDFSALIAFLQSDPIPMNEKVERANDALSMILFDVSVSLPILKSPLTVRAVVTCMQIVLQNCPTRIPLVQAVTMEKLVAQRPLQRLDSSAAFLLNLFYCFEFINCEPDSPFSIDPRTMPLKEVFSFLETVSADVVDDSLRQRLTFLVAHNCPEIPFRARAYQLVKTSRHFEPSKNETISVGQEKKRLKRILRRSLENRQEDPSGFHAQKAFLAACVTLSDADLLTTAMSALAPKARQPTFFFSYSMLYRDPLVALKCPIDILERMGWRRIVVYILSLLLATNESFVRALASDRDASLEYMCARNEVVMRCLLSVVCGGSTVCKHSQYHCCTTIGLVRRIVAEGRGAAAMLVKDSFSEKALDWLVENVPETIEE
jgi:hypothetical protein